MPRPPSFRVSFDPGFHPPLSDPSSCGVAVCLAVALPSKCEGRPLGGQHELPLGLCTGVPCGADGPVPSFGGVPSATPWRRSTLPRSAVRLSLRIASRAARLDVVRRGSYSLGDSSGAILGSCNEVAGTTAPRSSARGWEHRDVDDQGNGTRGSPCTGCMTAA